LGLLIAWGAVWLGQRRASIHYTYGFKRSTILAALLNAALILVALGAISLEAIHRFQAPLPIQENVVIGAASLGIVFNGLTAWLFAKEQDDLNLKGVFFHMLTDALVSVGVVLGAIAMMLTGQVWLDPAMSLVIVMLIFIGTWGLLKETVRLLLDGVPATIEMKAVQTFLREHPQVMGFHHLHVWALSTTETALTVHLVVDPALDAAQIVPDISDSLAKNFGISHSTIQLETTPTLECCQGMDNRCYQNP
jgi:cobalt-zinc-cadmium efflux system protein